MAATRKPDSQLARQYQAEWARIIEAEGRDPYARFPAAAARGRKLGRCSTPRTPVRLPASAYIPLDAERSYEAGLSYCQQGATVVALTPRGVGRVEVKEAA